MSNKRKVKSKNWIENRLRQNYTDEFTIKMFLNFIGEFKKCFPDIMKTEELVDRIINNVAGNIIITDDLKSNLNMDAKYGKDGIVYIKKSQIKDLEYLKYIFFHEMLHAISSVKDENGVEIYDGFFDIQNKKGHALNEAMTEYLTQLRNKKLKKENMNLVSEYRVIVEQIRKLANIIGEKELIELYFNNPQKLQQLLTEKNMNYDELEKSFKGLLAQDANVNNWINGKYLTNPQYYIIHRHAETIYNNFSNALGPVNSLDEFEKKYLFFQTSSNPQYDCISIMSLRYFEDIENDINSLLNRGIDISDIKACMSKIHIDYDKFKKMHLFLKCFTDDKNQTAINIYEQYRENPDNYWEFFISNHGTIYDYFSESGGIPNERTLYNGMRYPLIGSLLKEYPDIDYSEINMFYFNEKHLGLYIVIFQTADGRKYAYTLQGEKVAQITNQDEECIFKVHQGDDFDFNLVYSKDGQCNYYFEPKKDDCKLLANNLQFDTFRIYSDKSDIEYWIQQGEDNDGELQAKLKKINARILERRKLVHTL